MTAAVESAEIYRVAVPRSVRKETAAQPRAAATAAFQAKSASLTPVAHPTASANSAGRTGVAGNVVHVRLRKSALKMTSGIVGAARIPASGLVVSLLKNAIWRPVASLTAH